MVKILKAIGKCTFIYIIVSWWTYGLGCGLEETVDYMISNNEEITPSNLIDENTRFVLPEGIKKIFVSVKRLFKYITV